MSRVAPRVHVQADAIERLESMGAQLHENERVRIELDDGRIVEGIVELTPSLLVFFDPEGREGMNATVRLQPWLDDGRAQGRPAGLAVARDGALLVADDVGGRIWRVMPTATSTKTSSGDQP